MEKILSLEFTISVRYFPLCVCIYKMEVILPLVYLDSLKKKNDKINIKLLSKFFWIVLCKYKSLGLKLTHNLFSTKLLM